MNVAAEEGNSPMTLDRLAEIMAEGFHDLQGQLDSIHFRLDVMQDQILNIETDIKSMKLELQNINHRLDRLEDATSDIRGYAKEIDELRARVRRLEQVLKVKE